MNVRVATVTVPVRCGPVLGATAIVTVPLPVRPAPFVTVSHAASLMAVQPQDAAVVTEVDVVTPDAPAVRNVGEIA